MLTKRRKKLFAQLLRTARDMILGCSKNQEQNINPAIKVITDTGYQGIQKLHNKSELPKKKTKKNPLTQEERKRNQELASERVINENVIGMLKRFKIISDKYRNRRKRFGLRFNLIAAIYNWELNI